MTVNREALLRRENEYLTKKIKEELSTWRKNNYESAKHTVISIVISSLALVFGIFLFITEQINFGEEIKNIISTSVIGTGGSLTLYGSLASLKNLFKEVNENAEEFKNTMETFKSLYQNTEPQQESSVKVIEEHLEDYYKDQKKVFEFLEGLNKHMHHMLICRSITVTITSLVVLMLAIVSIFYLIINSENDIFEIIDILLICFSAIILYHSICVMICIQLIIPHITEHMFEKRRDKEKKKKEAAEKGSVQDEQQLKVQNQQQLNVQDEQQLKVQDQLQFKVQDQQQLKIQDKQLLKVQLKVQDQQLKIQDKQIKFGEYQSKVSLYKLIKVLYKNVKDGKGCFVRLIKLLELGIFILFIFCFFILGLVSGKWEFKRINIGDTEFEGINRILYGLPLKELDILEIAAKQINNNTDQTNQ